jgi:asparagine synthase (glutamine-hydrolysing)
MSGICGIFSPFKPELASAERLAPMMDAMIHRGATRRSFADVRCGLVIGHLFAAAFLPVHHMPRPHWREDSRVVAAVDGGVFGASPVMPLESGSEDVTRVVESLERDGSAFPASLDGPFALAVWRRAERELILARDGLGRQPLHIAPLPSGGVVFASELKGVLAHPAVERRIDPAALTAYLTFGYVPAPLTIFSTVRKVFPGEAIRVNSSGQVTSRSFWQPPSFAPGPGNLDDFAAELGSRLVATVAKHVNGAPRPGLFLSGGVDSTSLLLALARLGVRERHTLTIGFESGEGTARTMEDFHCAARVAARFATHHHAITIASDHDPRSLLPRTLRMIDEPSLTPNVYSKQFLGLAARAHGIESCLSGSNAGFSLERFTTRQIEKQRLRAGGSDSVEDLVIALRNRAFPCDEHAYLLAVPVPDSREVARALIRRYLAGLESDDISDLVSAAPMRMQGAEKGIATQDRAASLAGVTMRYPFYDTELLAFLHTIPSRYKGSESPEMKKEVLKRAFAEIPEEVAQRPVIGYASRYWTSGELDALRERLLSPAGLARSGLLRPEAVQQIVEADRASTKRSAGKRTWGLVVLQAWHELYVNDDDSFLSALDVTDDAPHDADARRSGTRAR